MYILNDDLKTRLGLLIEYYRAYNFKQTKDKKWELNSFLLDYKGEYICRDKTYKRIHTGLVTTKDEVYDALFEKLGVTFTTFPNKEKFALLELYTLLLIAIEFEDVDQIDQATKKCLKVLEQFRGNFYFIEYFEAIECIRAYYLDSKLMKEEQYQKLLIIYKVFEGDMMSIVMELMYRYCHLSSRDIAKLNQLSDAIGLESQSNVMLKMDYCLQLMFNRRVYEAHQLAITLLPKLIEDKKYNLLITLYSYLVGICNSFNVSQSEYYLDEMEHLLQHHASSISKSRQSRCSYSVGMQYFVSKNYSKSYEYLSRSVLLDMTNFDQAGIFIKHILSKTIIEQLELNRIDISSYSTRFQKIYKYFMLMDEMNITMRSTKKEILYKGQLHQLEDYILTVVRPLIVKDDFPLIGVFQEHIDWLASMTSSYGNALKFRTYFEKVQ